MKTSLDLPDDLYRRVKARSAMEGRAVREVATELLSAWVNSAPTSGSSPQVTPKAVSDWLYQWSALGARIERASKPKPLKPTKHKTSAGKSVKRQAKSKSPEEATSLVDQLRRDRR